MLKNEVFYLLSNSFIEVNMIQQLEADLSEETFDPKHNIDLAEIMAYLGELKERGLDNGYRAGIVTRELFGTLVDFGVKYLPGQIVVIKDSDTESGTFIVGRFPKLDSEYNRDKLYKEPLKPARPVDNVPKDYVREVN